MRRIKLPKKPQNNFQRTLKSVLNKFKNWKMVNEFYSQGEMTWTFENRKLGTACTVAVFDSSDLDEK